MKRTVGTRYQRNWRRFAGTAAVASTLSLSLLPITAQAQGRSRPSSPAPGIEPPARSVSPVFRPSLPSPRFAPSVPSFSPGVRPIGPSSFPAFPTIGGSVDRISLLPGAIVPVDRTIQSPRIILSTPTVRLQPNLPGVQTPTHQTVPSNYTSLDRFGHSSEGYAYHYPNGLYGRNHVTYYGATGLYYPYYYPGYIYGLTFASPYAYYGAVPSYIGPNDIYSVPPPYDYVPDSSAGSADGAPQNRADENMKKDALLNGAIADITGSWSGGDIGGLAKHVRRDARVAIYLRGKYQYSLDAGDYLDMTRDALKSTRTVSFTLDNIQRDQGGVYTVTGRHVYKDENGIARTVDVIYVLEKQDGDYYITQAGSAPDGGDQ